MWGENWEKNGWKTSHGKLPDNKDIIEIIRTKYKERKAETNFEWTKGHNDVPGNVEADKLAVNGAQKAAKLSS